MTSKPRGRGLVALSLIGLLSLGGCAYFKNSQTELEAAEVALQSGDLARAEELYRKVMTQSKKPNEVADARAFLIDLLIVKGGERLDANELDVAMDSYREALALDEARETSRIAYARALMKVERFTEAIDVLLDDQRCRGCKTMTSVIYIERGLANLRDGNYDAALEDFDLALGEVRDPLTVLHKVDAYTVGNHGEARDAVAFLEHALRLMPADQVGAQQLWWDKRAAVVYWAATRHDESGLNMALALEDPRKQVNAEQKRLDLLNLRMYAASVQLYAADYDQGIARGLQTFSEVRDVLEGDDLESLRQVLLSLFMQLASIHLAADEDGAARTVLAQGLELDPDNEILLGQQLIATAARSTGQARKLLAKMEGHPSHDKLQCLLELAYVRSMIGIGQFTAARAGLERAEKLGADLFDTRLTRAELEVTTRFEGLRTAWYQRYKEIGTFEYPKGQVMYYGRALAQIRHIQDLYDEAAAQDYLRMPAFQARLDALEKTITDFYPYDARLASSPDKALLLLQRKEEGEYVVKIEGPRKAHEITMKGKSEVEVELGGPGLAVVDTPGGRMAAFAEPGIEVVIEI